MHRPFARFVSVALTALFLAAAAGRASGVTPCPHHEAGAPTSNGHAGHAHHAPDQGEQPAPCNCLGACQVAIALSPPSGGAEIPVAPAPRDHNAVVTRDEPRPALHLTLLPYSTAPPAAR